MATVMVVDDTDAARKVMARLLQREGYQTVCAGNGREALSAIEATQPDLVLLDVCMPEMDGLTVLENIRRSPRFRSLPVIVMSALSDAMSQSKAKQLGAKDYLVKASFSWQEVLGKLKQHLPAA